MSVEDVQRRTPGCPGGETQSGMVIGRGGLGPTLDVCADQSSDGSTSESASAGALRRGGRRPPTEAEREAALVRRRRKDAQRKRKARAAAKRAARASKPATPPRSASGEPAPTHDAARAHAEAFRWESFEAGNFIAIRHGARSPRLVGRLAEELAEWARETCPDLRSERYALTLADWAWSEATVGLLRLFLDALGPADEVGAPRDALLASIRTSARHAAERRRELGLNPEAHARLESARAEAVSRVSLEELRARGAAALRARGVAVIGMDPEPEVLESGVPDGSDPAA
jgi:hypothetical protein